MFPTLKKKILLINERTVNFTTPNNKWRKDSPTARFLTVLTGKTLNSKRLITRAKTNHPLLRNSKSSNRLSWRVPKEYPTEEQQPSFKVSKVTGNKEVSKIRTTEKPFYLPTKNDNWKCKAMYLIFPSMRTTQDTSDWVCRQKMRENVARIYGNDLFY